MTYDLIYEGSGQKTLTRYENLTLAKYGAQSILEGLAGALEINEFTIGILTTEFGHNLADDGEATITFNGHRITGTKFAGATSGDTAPAMTDDEKTETT